MNGILAEAIKKQKASPKFIFLVCYLSILVIGIFARVWEFNKIPAGLNADEASSGVEAYALFHFGLDRNGNSYPIFFVAWGSGQSALYGYMTIPFIAILGLSPFSVRLPMLITSILCLLLIYPIGEYTFNKKTGLLAMFLLAISPWHIMMSRWGLPENIFPFIFLVGYYCLLRSFIKNIWFIPACIFFALCFYAYGTAYAFIPVFFGITIIVLLVRKTYKPKFLITGLIIFILLSLPMGLYIIINSFKLDSIHFLSITIPRLPSKPRYESISTIFAVQNFIYTMGQNIKTLAVLLIWQIDGEARNVLVPFGYLYTVTFSLAYFGAAFIARSLKKSDQFIQHFLLLLWITAAAVVGMIQHANFNRINIIFMSIILLVAYFLMLYERIWFIFPIAIAGFLIAFISFTAVYHGDAFRERINTVYLDGLVPAIDYIKQEKDNPNVCFSDQIDMTIAYVYVLFSDHMDPKSYLNTIVYEDPSADFRTVQHLNRYSFGLDHCANSPGTIYLLKNNDEVPIDESHYQIVPFGSYLVLSPKR